jgi:tricorn protease-like protein
MDLLIVRDQRTGGAYTDAAAKEDMERFGWYANEAADIEVEVGVCDLYKGTNDTDDPDSADVSGGAQVCKDIPKIDPVTKEETGEFLFRAGQVIELTDAELEEAHEKAIDEARESMIPEYSPD